MATKKKKPLTDAQRTKLAKGVMKGMIEGVNKGLTLVDLVESLIAVSAVLYPNTRLRIKVT